MRLALLFALVVSANSQVLPPGEAGVGLGHLHFHSDDRTAHVQFWVDVFGAEPTKVGNLELYKLPGMFIAIDAVKAASGMQGSTVPAVGLKVRDLSAVLAKANAAKAGVTKQGSAHAVVIGPDEIRVELTEDPKLKTDVASDSIHLDVPDPAAAREWYAKTFGASLPGVRLEFTKSEGTPAPTKNRVLDHIGFEVKDLRAFTKNLAATGQKVDLMYYKLPDSGVAIGFVTDPWGTFIELTEGLIRF